MSEFLTVSPDPSYRNAENQQSSLQISSGREETRPERLRLTSKCLDRECGSLKLATSQQIRFNYMYEYRGIPITALEFQTMHSDQEALPLPVAVSFNPFAGLKIDPTRLNVPPPEEWDRKTVVGDTRQFLQIGTS